MAVSSRFGLVYFKYDYDYSKYAAYPVVYRIIFIRPGLCGSAGFRLMIFNNPMRTRITWTVNHMHWSNIPHSFMMDG